MSPSKKQARRQRDQEEGEDRERSRESRRDEREREFLKRERELAARERAVAAAEQGLGTSALRFEWLLVLLRKCPCLYCRHRGRARKKYGRLVGWRGQHIVIVHLPVGAGCPDNQLRRWLLQAARHYGLEVSSAITVTLWRGALRLSARSLWLGEAAGQSLQPRQRASGW